MEESQRLASVDALGVASRRWAGLIAAARGVHCGGSVCPTAVANVSSGVIFTDGA